MRTRSNGISFGHEHTAPRLTSMRQLDEKVRDAIKHPRTIVDITTPHIWNIELYQRLVCTLLTSYDTCYTFGKWGAIFLSNGSKFKFITDLGTGTRREIC